MVMQVKSCKSNQIRIPFYVGEDKSRTWVRLINGRTLQPIKDYTTANGDGSRGIVGRWVLDPGFYEINHRYHWNKVRRYFLRVNYDGTTKEVSREEVHECLKSD